MAQKYVCRADEHPEDKHSRYYDETFDGFCPDCEYGTSLLEGPVDVDDDGNTPVPGRHLGEIGVCILVCDVSYSMTEQAFPPNNPAQKVTLVATAAANGIVDLYDTLTKQGEAYIAVVAFGENPLLIKAPDGKPFLKSVPQIKTAFPTRQELAAFLTQALMPREDQDMNSKYTGITKALNLARQIEQAARQGDLTQFGLEGTFSLKEHDIVTKGDSQSVPNVRTLIYSDGGHNPSDGTPLSNPYQSDNISTLMTCFFGDPTSSVDAKTGTEQMREIACTCPIHGVKGFFLINTPDRYQTLRKLFRMASGTSGFCPVCLVGHNKEYQTQKANTNR